MTEKPEEAPLHWSQHDEQAAGYWQLQFLLVLFRIFPTVVLRIIAFPVGFFYFLFSKRGRTESRRFLQKAAPLVEEPRIAKKCRSPFGPLRHIISFSLTIVEKLQAWGNRFPLKNVYFQDDDITELVRELENGKGVFLIFSHLGNMELLRGLLYFGKTRVSRKIPFTAIMDMKTTAHFNRILKELHPQSDMDVISGDDISPATAVLIEEKITAGGMIVFAGDRTSVDGKNRMIPFMGKEAPFSSGIFYMPALVNAPVYFVFALRRKDLSLKPEYDMHVHKSPLSFDCPRKDRLVRSSLLTDSFASLLEGYCKKQPFQWYNFFDFWQEGA
jgi:predicted LPLAT superfamily acyltransferase